MDRKLLFSLTIAITVLILTSCPLPLPQVSNVSVAAAALPPDVINDVPRSAGGAFTFRTLLPVTLSLDVELYDSMGGSAETFFSRKIGAEGAVIIATLKDPRGNLVYAGRIPDGHLRALLTLPSGPEDMTLSLHADGFADRSVAVAEMVRYSEVSRTMGMLSRGDRAKSLDSLADDGDGDLVPDVYDAFPDDPESAFAYRIPADGNLTVAYEDLYGLARAGDADYNDFIAEYSITEVTNGENELHRIEVSAEETVKLAGYNHRFGIRVDGFEGSAHLTGVSVDQFGNSVSIDRTEMSYANIDLFQRTNVALNKHATFTLEFDTPQVIDPSKGTPAVDRPPYNPWLSVLNTGEEIHLMGEQDLGGVPHGYQDSEGFPWGLLVPTDWANPAETERIEVHYPRFTNWRQSFGAEFTDWYLHFDDPYVPLPDIAVEETQVTASAAAETSPRLGRDETSELVVYTSQPLMNDGSYGYGDILFQRWDAAPRAWGQAVQISSGATDDKFNDVSGSRIVYTAFASQTSVDGMLMVYDVEQGTTFPVLPEADTVRESRIDGDVVVWTQGQNAATRVLYRDLSWSSGVTVTLGGPTPAASNVEIGSRYVVWEKATNSQKDIAAYDRVTGAWITVSADQGVDDRLPSTSGNYVVWQAKSDTGTTIEIANLSIKPVTHSTAVNNGAYVGRPCVDGDFVAFESDVSGNMDVYLYRISDGGIFQVTDQEDDQFLVSLSGDKVAYVDLRGESLDIYATEFSLPPGE